MSNKYNVKVSRITLTQELRVRADSRADLLDFIGNRYWSCLEHDIVELGGNEYVVLLKLQDSREYEEDKEVE